MAVVVEICRSRYCRSGHEREAPDPFPFVKWASLAGTHEHQMYKRFPKDPQSPTPVHPQLYSVPPNR